MTVRSKPFSILARSLLALAFASASVFAIAHLAGCSDHAKDEVNARVNEASALEQGQQFHDAIGLYKELLARQLDPSQRADVRFRLARCQIAGGDLNGSLETLEDLTAEDVKSTQIDIGELFLDLGDKYFAKGEKKKAQVAWQMGRGVSPARVPTFNQRIEQLIPPAPEPKGANGK